MKRVLLLVALSVFLSAASGFAQSSDDAFFVKTIPLIKVYSHQLGYKVLYLKGGAQVAEMYLPLTWFGQTAGRAQLIWGVGSEFPYLSLFYKGDKFDHLRLYVHKDMLSATWGILQMSMADAGPLFKVEEPPLNY